MLTVFGTPTFENSTGSVRQSPHHNGLHTEALSHQQELAPLTESSIKFVAPVKWRIIYGILAMMPAVFSLVPAYCALNSNEEFQPSFGSIVVMTIFTIFMISLALLLLYTCVRNVEISIDNQHRLTRLTRILWLQFSVPLEFDRIELSSYWYGRTFKTEIQTLSGFNQGREVAIASGLDSTKVNELFEWFRQNTKIECVDQRNRTAVG